ncbi:MAG: hypothetical protein JNK16_05405 [Phycisphaerales bacterium]|nr:hypothetical protein [Phycisphaerales bacterium]
MGFNLQSATASEVLEDEDAAEWTAFIRKHLGQSVPLGTPGNHYCHTDEMGWSWWKQLQEHATRELDDPKNLLAVDAWFGAYFDGPIDRTVLRRRPQPASEQAKDLVAATTVGFLDRLRSMIGLTPKNLVANNAARHALNDMYRQFGPRAGEADGLQIASLRGVLDEANQLLEKLGTPANADAVNSLLESYTQDDARCETDPHIQCLCHLWLTANHALEHRQPMWCIK